MSEKLTIKGFAGLGELSIDLRKINVFIGPQATGKSVTAKLLYLFKLFARELPPAALQGVGEEGLKGRCLSTFREYFPERTWEEGAFSVRYECADEFAAIQKAPGKTQDLALTYSPFYGDLLRKLMKLVEDTIQEHPQGTDAGTLARLRVY